MSKIYITVHYVYQERKHEDCLHGHNIHTLSSNATSIHANCKEWCNINGNCGGFSVHNNTCSLKTLDCKDDLYNSFNVDIFMKQGSLFTSRSNTVLYKIYIDCIIKMSHFRYFRLISSHQIINDIFSRFSFFISNESIQFLYSFKKVFCPLLLNFHTCNI